MPGTNQPPLDFAIDGNVGQGHFTEAMMLSHLQLQANFCFKPTQPEDKLPTVKLEDYFVTDKDGTVCSLMAVKFSRHRLKLSGNIKSWNGGDFNYGAGGIHLREWSFQDNADKTGFDVFASSRSAHYLLGKPNDSFKHCAKEPAGVLKALHWLCKEITEGDFSYHNPEAGGPTMHDFIGNRKHLDFLWEIGTMWDFIKDKIAEQVGIDHPNYIYSPLWLHMVEMHDDPIPDHHESDDEEHGDSDGDGEDEL